MNFKKNILLVYGLCLSGAVFAKTNYFFNQGKEPLPQEKCDGIVDAALHSEEGNQIFFEFFFLSNPANKAHIDGKLRDIAYIVNCKNKQGRILWHSCLEDGYRFREEILRGYLELGANPNVQDEQGKMSLHYVSDSEKEQQCEDYYPTDITKAGILLKAGARLDIQDKEGNTPLIVANRGRLALFLLNNGANIHDRSSTDQTMLHRACLLDTSDLLDCCFKANLDLNARDNEGKTPLFFVRSFYMTEKLVKKGADVNARDNKGRTCLHNAVCLQDDVMIKTALFAGVDYNIQDNDGKTAAELATDDKTKEFLLGLITKIEAGNPRDDLRLTWF